VRFVVQLHRAHTVHYDFRLEKDGVLKSWAVPKGLPEKIGVRRLAVQVEDHDLSFGDFEGAIPEGEYGAGEIRIWDQGTYETREWTDKRIVVVLHGARLHGAYSLIRFRRKGEREWLIQKLRQSDATEG
jgi:bifunctional non-homologous end joining protein LigD